MSSSTTYRWRAIRPGSSHLQRYSENRAFGTELADFFVFCFPDRYSEILEYHNVGGDDEVGGGGGGQEVENGNQ